MVDLSITSNYMRRIIEKMRAIMAREGEVMPDLGGNESDDETGATLQEVPGDLQSQELEEELSALDADEKCELVALMWVGRGDFGADEWDEAMELARERHTGPTASYLLSHPLVADEIASGLEELGFSHVLQDGEY